jgi:hypothetical protein
MHPLRVPPSPGALIAVHRARHLAGTVLLAALFAVTAAGQIIRPTPPIVVPPGGGGGGGGGGAGGGGGGPGPIFPGGPGIGLPGTTAPEPTIVVTRGALAGQSVTAAIAFPATETGQTTAATYQWSLTGGRLTSDPRERTVEFVADRTGIVTLTATVGANGTAYNPTAQVTVFGTDAAGSVTAPARVTAGATTVTATVPAARNGDRTFRWTVSGDATITAGQGTPTVTFRPGAAGLKQVTCNVTLQNLVTVPVRAYLVVTGSGPEVEVTVNSGSGGGTFRAGSRVDVFAHPPAADEVFDRWTGDTDLLEGGALAATLARPTLTVPERPVTLTATYRPAPAWIPATVRNFNTPAQAASPAPATAAAPGLVYHVPGDAMGLVFLLHDAGDTGAGWFERPEPLLFVRELVAAGFGVAAVDSANRTAGTWSTATTLTTNPDALDHAAALDRLIGEGSIAATTPVFFVGVGNGGDAAARIADLLAAARPARPVRGAVLYLAAGNETLSAASRVPQFFALAANDEALGAVGQAAARENSRLLLGRGIATGVVNQTVSPLLPGRLRMLRLSDPGFTEADADAIWAAVKETGALDANHYVQTPPTAAALATALPAAYRARARDVADQLAVAAAGRAFSADSNRRVIAFLQARAASAPSAAPGRVVNLSTRAQIAYLGDTFTIGFTLTGSQRATLLVRGIGPGLARLGVRDAIPAQRLEVRRGSTLVAANETWGQADNAAQLAATAGAVGAFALTPGSLDSALLVNLEPGTYLATISGLNGTVGDVLGEIYDVSRNGTRITNLSVLANVSAAGEVVIPGLVIAGNNPRTLLVRAVGPSLANVGLPAANLLPDPRLTVFSGNQAVANNNNWAQAGAATLNAVTTATGAFPLADASDAALVSALAPGNYTLQAGAAPAAGATVASGLGTVLVEVYEVP